MTNKQATIEEILAAKKLVEKSRKNVFYSKTLNLEFKIDDIEPDRIVNIIKAASENEPIRSDCELIYECCSIFRSKELQEQFNISDPVKTVQEVFCNDLQEIDKFAKQIAANYGFIDVAKVEAVKKQ